MAANTPPFLKGAVEGFDYLKWNLGARCHLHVQGEAARVKQDVGGTEGLLPAAAAAAPTPSPATDLGIGPVFFFFPPLSLILLNQLPLMN